MNRTSGVDTMDREVFEMANQEIFCVVNSCYYWGSGDHCMASKIMVKNNPATLDARMEIGTIGSDARTSNQTLCETFIPEEKGPKNGIERLDRK